MRKINDQNDIEKLLNDKMKDLSDTVDVFSKITDRAYPQSMTDTSDNGYIVTGLENVTARSRRHRVLKWISAAAAVAVLCFVIPKTDIVPKMLSHISTEGENRYQSAVNRMNNAVGWGDFIVFDVPLSYYIKNDVLITPLMPCPFEDSDKDNALVRLFIRTVDGIATNEVYAVEYTDSFDKSRYIAVACSDVQFTKEEVSRLELCDRIIPEPYCQEAEDAIENRFYDDEGGILKLDGKTAVSLASYSLMQYVKTTDDETRLAVTDVIYYHEQARFNEQHYYDTYTYTTTINGDEEVKNLPEREYSWKRSVYFSGSAAFPDKNGSDFTKTEIFGTSTAGEHHRKGWAAVQPLTDNPVLDNIYGDRLDLEYNNSFANQGTFSTVLSPAEYCTSGFRMYFSPYKEENYYYSSNSDTIKDIRITLGDREIYRSHSSIPSAKYRESETVFSPSYMEYVYDSVSSGLSFSHEELDTLTAELNKKNQIIEDLKLKQKTEYSEEREVEITQYSLEVLSLEQQIRYHVQRINMAEQYKSTHSEGEESFGTHDFGTGE